MRGRGAGGQLHGGGGSLLAEEEEEEEVKIPQKNVKASAKPEAVPAPMKPVTKVTVAGTRAKRRRKHRIFGQPNMTLRSARCPFRRSVF